MNLSAIKEALQQLETQVAYLETKKDDLQVIDRDAMLDTIRTLYNACLETVTNEDKLSAAALQEAAAAEKARLEAARQAEEEARKVVQAELAALKQKEEALKAREAEIQQKLEQEEKAKIAALAKAKAMAEEEAALEAARLAEAAKAEAAKRAEALAKEAAAEAARVEAEKQAVLKAQNDAAMKMKMEEAARKLAEEERQRKAMEAEQQKEVIDEVTFNEEYEPLFIFQQATDLSAKLAEQPIADLTKAFSLNDKILYIQNLFGGDSGSFNNALKAINEAEDFNAVRVYIETNLVESGNWMDKHRVTLAKDFVKLVRRRHL